MNRGRHAADDGSFNRSAGMAAGRGAALLAVAVLLGILLLSATDDGPSGVTAGAPSEGPVDNPTTSTTDFSSTTSTVAARAPAEVRVLTLNGTDVRGAAGRANDVVKNGGFNVLAPADAAGEAKGATTSAVYFTPTYEQEAAAVARALGIPSTSVQAVPAPPPAPDLKGANVVVLVGSDLATDQAPAGSTSSTTTAAPGRAGAATSTTGG